MLLIKYIGLYERTVTNSGSKFQYYVGNTYYERYGVTVRRLICRHLEKDEYFSFYLRTATP